MNLIFSEKSICFLTSWETNCQKLFFDPEPKMDMTWPGQADPDGVATPDPLKKKTIHYFELINYKYVLFEKDYYSWIVMMIMVWSDIFTILKKKKKS